MLDSDNRRNEHGSKAGQEVLRWQNEHIQKTPHIKGILFAFFERLALILPSRWQNVLNNYFYTLEIGSTGQWSLRKRVTKVSLEIVFIFLPFWISFSGKRIQAEAVVSQKETDLYRARASIHVAEYYEEAEKELPNPVYQSPWVCCWILSCA